MKKELLESIEEWGYKVESENPLIIVGLEENKERFVGLLADLLISDIKEEMGINDNSSDVETIKNMNDDQQLLLTVSVNYADEFDMSEWLIIDAGTFKKVIEVAENYDDEIEWYFGTNEELFYDDGNEMLSEIEVNKITQEEADSVISVFDMSSFGEAGFFDTLFDLSDDEGSEEDEETFEGFTSIIGKLEKRWIDFLEENGWSVTQDKDDEWLFIVKKGDDKSLISYVYLEELYNYVKRNKC